MDLFVTFFILTSIYMSIVFLRFSHDATFISIMIWTSVSMVILLHRGHAETRAAHTILMLVVTFVALYLLNFICIIFHTILTDWGLLLRHVDEALTAGFPTISPFLLIFRDPKDPCSVLFNC
uniref:Vomeronasal type-1 receptor n=1 Tax=Peromyscus maniculatus bairdii TaxID=230844 RepID=A0A8C8UF34_PERMB